MVAVEVLAVHRVAVAARRPAAAVARRRVDVVVRRKRQLRERMAAVTLSRKHHRNANQL